MQVEFTPRWLPDVYVAHFLAVAQSAYPWLKRRSGNYFEHRVLYLPPEYQSFDEVQPRSRRQLRLLKTPDDAEIRPHKDDDPGLLRQRIVMLQPALEGGVLTVEGVDYPMQPGDSTIFDGNSQLHHVTRVRGERLVLAVSTYR